MSKIVVDQIEDASSGKTFDVENLFANTTNAVFSGDVRVSGKMGIGTYDLPTNLTVYGSASGGISELTDNTSIVIDMSSNNNFSITLAGSNTFVNPVNPTPGQSGIIWITQDATGNRAPAWGSYWRFPSNTAPTLTTDGDSVDAIVYTIRTATSITAVAHLNIG